jgi:hypothetical protein
MSRADLLAHFAPGDSDSDSSQDASDGHPEEESFHEPLLTPARSIVLISKEGTRFYLSVEVAKVSGLLSCFLEPGVEFAETQSGEIHLDTIRSIVLERVIDYMHFNSIWHAHCARMPRFPVDRAITIETFIAADFLQL